LQGQPVLHTLKGKVEQELHNITVQGVIEPVEMSEWTAAIVPVLKPDGTIRICRDYCLMVN